MNERARLTELDALRGIAAAAVVVYHYTLFAYENIKLPASPLMQSPALSWLYPFYTGEYGVSLFFVISGFVISMTLERIKRPMDFLVSRFSRLYPAFWCGVVVTTIFRLAVWREDFDLEFFVTNLTMFPTWFGQTYTDGVYWTLNVEMQFYAIMLLLWRLKALEHVEFVCIGWFVLLAATQLAAGHGFASIANVVSDVLILKHIPLFGAGMMFYRIHAAGVTKGRLAVIAIAGLATWLSGNVLKSAVVTVVFLVMGLLCARKLDALANSRTLRWLGDRSYAIYLVHSMIGLMLMQKLVSLGIVLMFLIPLLVSITIAEVINRAVEKPSLNAIRRWYSKRNVRTAAVAS